MRKFLIVVSAILLIVIALPAVLARAQSTSETFTASVTCPNVVHFKYSGSSDFNFRVIALDGQGVEIGQGYLYTGSSEGKFGLTVNPFGKVTVVLVQSTQEKVPSSSPIAFVITNPACGGKPIPAPICVQGKDNLGQGGGDVANTPVPVPPTATQIPPQSTNPPGHNPTSTSVAPTGTKKPEGTPNSTVPPTVTEGTPPATEGTPPATEGTPPATVEPTSTQIQTEQPTEVKTEEPTNVPPTNPPPTEPPPTYRPTDVPPTEVPPTNPPPTNPPATNPPPTNPPPTEKVCTSDDNGNNKDCGNHNGDNNGNGNHGDNNPGNNGSQATPTGDSNGSGPGNGSNGNNDPKPTKDHGHGNTGTDTP